MRRRQPSPAVSPLATIADEADDRVRTEVDARPERGCLACQVGKDAPSLCHAWFRDDPRDGSPILRHNGRLAALSRFEEAGNVESSLLNRGGVDDWKRFHALIVPFPGALHGREWGRREWGLVYVLQSTGPIGAGVPAERGLIGLRSWPGPPGYRARRSGRRSRGSRGAPLPDPLSPQPTGCSAAREGWRRGDRTAG